MKTNNTDKPMEGELTIKQRAEVLVEALAIVKKYTHQVTIVEQVIQEAIQATREETVNEIKDWVNTSQKSESDKWNHRILMGLWNFLDSLTNKSENHE